MANIRLIGRLDIKGPNLIKGVHLEGLRVIGDPREFATRYYEEGIDELIYLDIVASLYGRNNLFDIVRYTAQNIFIPLTAGGGIRSVADVEQMLLSGADKVAVNTAAIQRPELISEIATRFGSQCMVLSIEAKKQPNGEWECYTDNGRERTGRNVMDWVRQGAALGAGEILLTSVDQEGTRKGFDVELCRAVSSAVPIPLIASGGMGTTEHCITVCRQGHADAVAMADVLHHHRLSIAEIRAAAMAANLPVRKP